MFDAQRQLSSDPHWLEYFHNSNSRWPLAIHISFNIRGGMTATRGAQIAARLLSRNKRSLSLAHERHFVNPPSRYANAAYPTHTRRSLHSQHVHEAQAATVQSTEDTWNAPSDSTNPALSFPCLDAQEAKTATLQRHSHATGPEPSYTTGKHMVFRSETPILLDWGGVLRDFEIAHETWGTLNLDKSNAILLHTGLSASSHAHSTARSEEHTSDSSHNPRSRMPSSA